MLKKYPKVLIVGRVAWTANQSTLSSIFHNYPAENLAYICIETQEPDYGCCANHFQISEIALIKRLFNKKTKTGRRREPSIQSNEEQSLERSEASTMRWVRKHRSSLFLYVRELLWRFGGWKTKELQDFIHDFNPDVLFFVGDPLPLINRLHKYVLNVTGLPAAIFMMDDIWSYKIGHTLLRYLLRKEVKSLIPACSAHFAISEMMKREYDDLFNINCVILTKAITERETKPEFFHLHHPIQMVYTGKLIYGREKSLAKVAEALSEINADGKVKAELHIYTQTEITTKLDKVLNIKRSSYLHKPVPYAAVAKVLEASDVVLFVESLEHSQKYIARLSFSTKVTDYLASGKCIVAIGDKEIAPIDYLKNNNAALVCSDYEEIKRQIMELLNEPERIGLYAECGYNLGIRNHNEDLMEKRLLTEIIRITQLPHAFVSSGV